MSERMIGTVKFFNDAKGYGFITPDSPQQKDVFVHVTAIERAGLKTPKEGDRLSFEIQQDRRSGKYAASNLAAA